MNIWKRLHPKWNKQAKYDAFMTGFVILLALILYITMG